MTIITEKQEIILNEFRNDPFTKPTFYFTGGSALSEYYLKHRYSEDLVFFSEKPFNIEILLSSLKKWSTKNKFTIDYRTIQDVTHIFSFNFSDSEKIKVDFAFYPHKRVEIGKTIKDIKIDSLLDISINKLSSINQRTEVKDFVDLFYLFNSYTTWDLLRGAEVKFGYEIDPILLASDFLKIEEFDHLPRMLTPLTLPDLKKFFLEKAKEAASKAVTK